MSSPNEAKPVFQVPVMVAVAADSQTQARELASGSLMHMLEVSNDEGALREVVVYPAGATERLERVQQTPTWVPQMPDHAQRIVVCLDGGLVQSVVSAAPIEVLVVDYDVEGADADELTAIDQGDGTVAEGSCSLWADGVHVNEKRLGEILVSAGMTV
ncbi:hypothetical protein [Rubrivivax gelatinosus]|uniref:hypothetical protein n=1 Tax=Rubrivivax gelatinosus TaxID=28068 RepID=UPI0012FDD222|nr:hypothetical protein [Rubrivivax gelatinosus]MBG6083064.1 hypothetical protein [Rubrivivax gelatinosus]